METQFMAKQRTGLPPGLITKKFLKQFKSEEDISNFIKDLHSQISEQM